MAAILAFQNNKATVMSVSQINPGGGGGARGRGEWGGRLELFLM